MPGSKENSNISYEAEAGFDFADLPGQTGSQVDDVRQLWQIVLRDLNSQLTRSEYDSWIKNLSLTSLSQGMALVAAPSSYACRRLENDYSDLITSILSHAVGYPVNVQFIVEAPVQGQLFEQLPAQSRNQHSYGQPGSRPAPGPGIKARGPSLKLDGPNSGTALRSPQNRPVSNYSNGNSNSRSIYTGNVSYGVKGRNGPALEQALENLQSYNYDGSTDLPDQLIGGDVETDNNYDGVAEAAGLNPRYIFDRYIVGSSNRMAYAAGRSVAENPGNSYNPLFIYGGVGLGKTHLLHAIGHEALRLRPYLKVLYVSSEKFTNELISGIREQRMDEFRSRYRNIDLLMIDDIQFIANKEQTQEEFFHTFNTLVEANKQVVISSDRSPKSMLVLSDRLRSRFEGGLISDISLPDYEMRLAILQAKAQYQPIPIPADVMEFIAHKVPSNIRELEGALIRVVAFGFLNKLPMTAEVASQALNDSLLNSRKKLVTKERIVEAVANFFNVEIKELQGRSRSADIVLPRQVAMYIIREQTDHSLVEVGQSLGGRDHTTVMHGLEKIEQAIETNMQLRQQINTITQIVYNGEGLK